MAPVRAKTGSFSVTAYRGDAKTLLAFNLTTKPSRRNLAGFTVEVKPPGVAPYYLLNALSFKDPAKHAQVATEPATSTVNAPLHRFRWVHHPGCSIKALRRSWASTPTRSRPAISTRHNLSCRWTPASAPR